MAASNDRAEKANHFNDTRKDHSGAKLVFGGMAAILPDDWTDAPGKVNGAVAKQFKMEDLAR